jgi:hypothetical protein
MGVVWQAYDLRLRREVAVKQLRLEPGLDPREADEARARAMREGRIAARLHHPNAVAVYDVVDEDDAPWLVMEYLPSRSLADEMTERGVLQPEEVARIGLQVASALAAAHEAGIVHRDIKPANVLIGDNGVVKITDFGISRAKGDVAVTKTGLIAGTPAYLAPEVAYGRDPEAPSDIFSLGSTLYAAVEGQPPFGMSENTLGLLHAVAAGRIIPPQQAGGLTEVLVRLLDAEPENRPTAAQAMRWLDAVARGTRPRMAPVGEGTATSLVAGPTSMMPPGPTMAMRRPQQDPRTMVTGPRGSGYRTGYAQPPEPAPRSKKPLVFAGLGVVAVVGLATALVLSGILTPTSKNGPNTVGNDNPTGQNQVTTVTNVPAGGYSQPSLPTRHGHPTTTQPTTTQPTTTQQTTTTDQPTSSEPPSTTTSSKPTPPTTSPSGQAGH